MRLREALHIDLSIRWISLMLFILCLLLKVYYFFSLHSPTSTNSPMQGSKHDFPGKLADFQVHRWDHEAGREALSAGHSQAHHRRGLSHVSLCSFLIFFLFTFWKIWPPTPHRKNLHRSARNTNPVKSTRWSSRSLRTWRQTGWGEERSGCVLSPLLLCGELCCLTAAAGLRRKTFGIMSTASSTLSPPPASAAPLSCAISSSLWGSLPPHVSKVTETEHIFFT